MRRFLCAAVVSLSLFACGSDSALKPRSGGSPYEVLLMTDDTGLRKVMDSILTVDVPALPQSEPLFRVSHSTATALAQATHYARNIVMVTKDSTLVSSRVRYERDTYAKPQLIVRISTPSEDGLKNVARQLTQLLGSFELDACAENLRKDQNAGAGRVVAKMFGWQMLVPREFTSMKKGRDFLWMSDNGKLTMGNICVYTYSGATLDPVTLMDKRDSIMALNIQGETPQMRMTTERRIPIVTEKTADGMVCRGLWQMENDAMGGPFVCRAMVDTARGRVVVAEGFVYAPGRKKSDKLHRLEAALSTLKKKR